MSKEGYKGFIEWERALPSASECHSLAMSAKTEMEFELRNLAYARDPGTHSCWEIVSLAQARSEAECFIVCMLMWLLQD